MSSRRFASMLLGGLAFAPAAPAQASEITFGSHDIQTTFFISKSDDRNRVDYGMRLDAACAPYGEEAVFPYWRELEKSPDRKVSLSMLDQIAFGIAEQRTIARTETGGEYTIRLKQVDRLIEITTKKEADGTCSALTRSAVNGAQVQLVSVFAKLAGFASVDYIDVFGKDLQSGAAVTERIKK
ncbi:MAG: DUF4833 domain-containing protein [Byssovorax sp.]